MNKMLARGVAAGPTVVFGAVLLLVLWAYWPGQNGPLLLDDQSSLLVLDLLDRPALASEIILGEKSGPTGRPVSMASFVADRLLIDEGIAGSKRTNIFIHLINGLLVTWLMMLLFKWAGFYQSSWLAVICGGLWLVAPLHISTVLYAVQRMAMLAAMFTFGACIAYVYWRNVVSCKSYAPKRFLLVVLAFLLAVYSKENALVTIPLLLFMEVFWFQCKDKDGNEITWLKNGNIVLLSVGFLVALLLLLLFYEWLSLRFGSRDFTLEQRLMSESRAVWHYIGQWFWPDMTKLGLYHDDFVVSASLDKPISTLWSLVAWIGAGIVLVLMCVRPLGRLLAFGPVFFLTAHSIESTVWPLEIYFEHRNYLPSFGLVLLVGTVLGTLEKKAPGIQVPSLVWVFFYGLILLLRMGSQVQIWSSGPLLTLNHLNGHPQSARANADMAARLASAGALESALGYSERAHQLANTKMAAANESSGDRDVRNLVLSCLARKPLPVSEIERIGESSPDRPLGSVHTLHVLVRVIQDGVCPGGNWDGLSEHFAGLYLADKSVGRASANMYSVLAGFENANGNYLRAYRYTEKYLSLSPGDVRGQLMQLHFTTALGKVEEAQALKEALLQKQSRGELTVGEQENLALYLE